MRNAAPLMLLPLFLAGACNPNAKDAELAEAHRQLAAARVEAAQLAERLKFAEMQRNSAQFALNEASETIKVLRKENLRLWPQTPEWRTLDPLIKNRLIRQQEELRAAR